MLRLRALFVLVLWTLVTGFSPAAPVPKIQEQAVPENGVQPQVIATREGTVHLVYLRGDARSCDVRYTRRQGAAAWSPPVTVNSRPGTAIAAGTIRGAQMALGKDGSVQVLWNGQQTEKGRPGVPGKSPLWHARLQRGATTFTPQQDLMSDALALDGGASIAATPEGRVAVVWHGLPAGAEPGETQRVVLLRESTDDGSTFGPPKTLNAGQPGVCACCSLRACMDATGALNVLYRAARSLDDRPMTLLKQQGGEAFSVRTLETWRIAACPMSSATFLQTPAGLRGAWETGTRVRSGLLDSKPDTWRPAGPENAKHPALALNAQGETLIAMIGGSGWAKGGKLHWRVLSASGEPMADGVGADVPVWSFPAVYALPDGTFVILR